MLGVSIVFLVLFLAQSAVFCYLFILLTKERTSEREDFMRELRRKVYLGSGAKADEAANAIIAEDLNKLEAELAKIMPKKDNKPKSHSLDRIQLPNGAFIERET